MRMVPWSLGGSDNAFDIQAEMERPAEMVPRDPREVLTENKVGGRFTERTWTCLPRSGVRCPVPRTDDSKLTVKRMSEIIEALSRLVWVLRIGCG